MKRILMILFCIITFYGCYKDDLATVNDTEYHNEATTRAAITGDYYWGSNGKIPITKSADKVWVLFKEDNGTMRSSIQTVGLSSIQDYSLASYSEKRDTEVFTNLKYGVGEIKDASSLTNLESVVYVAPYYKLEDEKEYPLTNIFYVELKDAKDSSKLEELSNKNNVTIVGKIPLTDNAYILACTKDSSGNALDMANLFYETGMFLSSTPEFISVKPESVNDTYYPQQWNLVNTGQRGVAGIDINFANVRSLTTGSDNITIAIIDEGVSSSHPDINVNHIHDAISKADTEVISGNHGTCCAGIISAITNNGQGIAGIAPNCKLMSISVDFDAANSTAALAYAIRYAADNGADVISNSWGSGTNQSIINSAIEHALKNGRNGKGCVVVFSSGNSDASQVNYPKAAFPDILVVGAITPHGGRKTKTYTDNYQPWGSNYGSALDVMAPGTFICTTNLNGQYMLQFGGTSSACPHVAGIAGLILSVNPNLTQKQVAHAIETTARKVGNYDYALTPERENGTWNNEMGYGLVDAYAAVLAGSSCFPYISNRIYISDAVVNGCEINTTNIIVSRNSTLTLQAPKVVINPLLQIQSGSSLVITSQ